LSGRAQDYIMLGEVLERCIADAMLDRLDHCSWTRVRGAFYEMDVCLDVTTVLAGHLTTMKSLAARLWSLASEAWGLSVARTGAIQFHR
jgi:hypothetical protein